MSHAWMVRAGDDNELVEIFSAKKLVAIGWNAMGDVASLADREGFKRAYAAAYPDHSIRKANTNAGQIYRFYREMSVGDFVLSYDKATRVYKVGEITSDARYSPATIDGYPNIRSVTWKAIVKRDDLSPSAKNTLGSTMTVFTFDSCAEEIRSRMGLPGTLAPVPPSEEEDAAPYAEEVQGRADELISDIVSGLDAYEFQALVAGVLRAMGFRTKESDPGRDRGIDIVATSDAFGFSPPTIKVQVKHRTTKSSGPEIRSFISALNSEDKGIFISSGGFTEDARTEALRAGGRISLMERDDFISLMLERYVKLEPRFQAMVPLVMVWLPAKG